MRKLLFSLCLASASWSLPAAANLDLVAALEGTHRSEANRARDEFRHPLETLSFFGIKPGMTVVELWPGGGWYSEILAPYLKDDGKLYAAHFNPQSPVGYFVKSLSQYQAKLAAAPDVYGGVEITVFDPPELGNIAPAGSADAVLTFRNLHNWYMRGGGEERLSAALQAVFRALKPGGVFGVVDHRMPADRALSQQDKSGYMREDYVIQAVRKAGFELVAKSEINANPKDSADHPKGVWTLPPSLRLGAKDMETYLTIGESDRMTLLFRKPQSRRSMR